MKERPFAFNMNDKLRVTLNGVGERLWHVTQAAFVKDVYEKLGIDIGEYRRDLPKANADGTRDFQFWEFCNVFGPQFYMGANVPITGPIILLRQEWTDKSLPEYQAIEEGIR